MSLENIFVFSLACLVASIACPWAAALSRSMGAVERGVAVARPLPRCGGLAIFAGLHIASLFVFWFPGLSFAGVVDGSWWAAFAAASFTLLVVGAMDDVYSLSLPARIAGQAMAATFAFASGLDAAKLLGLALPLPAAYLCTVAFLVVVTSAMRSFDGIEGAAPGAAAIAAAGLASTYAARGLFTESFLLVAFGGACSGFLVRGLVPARVALGSAGGMILGFTLGCLILVAAGEGSRMESAVIPMLVLALPLVDLGLALWRRGIRALLSWLLDQPGSPRGRDLEHLPHRLLESGSSPRGACLAIFLFGGSLSACASAAAFWPDGARAMMVLMILSVLAMSSRAALDVEIRGTVLAAAHLLGRDTKPGASRAAYFLLSVTVLALSHLCASLVTRMSSERELSLAPLLLCAILPALSCMRPRAREGVRAFAPPPELAFCVLGASAVSFWLETVGGVPPLEAAIECLVYSGLACGSIQALGLLPQAIETCMLYGDGSAERVNVLLCGSPLVLRRFVDEAGNGARVIGIVSGSPIDTRISASGEPAVLGDVAMLGEIQDIPRLIASHCVHRIVVASDMPLEGKREVQRLASLHAVPVSEWSCQRGHDRVEEMRA